VSSSSSSSESASSLLQSSAQASEPSVAYTRGVRLRRFAQTRFVANAVDAFRFRVEAFDNYLMPKEIFRYERKAWPSGGTVDAFDGVASPVDIEEYPVGEPNAGDVIQYFRTHEIDLVLRTQREADEAWRVLREEVDILIETLNLMDDLVLEATATFGNPPPGGESSSSES